MCRYGVATIRGLLKITGLFCKRALLKRQYSAKETYNLRSLLIVASPYLIRGSCVACQKRSIYTKRNLQKRPTDMKKDLEKTYLLPVATSSAATASCTRQKRPTCAKRDLQKRPTRKTYLLHVATSSVATVSCTRQKRPVKETCKRDLEKRPTCTKRVLQKRRVYCMSLSHLRHLCRVRVKRVLCVRKETYKRDLHRRRGCCILILL